MIQPRRKLNCQNNYEFTRRLRAAFFRKERTMTTLKINETEYKIKYGYEATVKNGIVKKLIEVEQGDDAERVEKILSFLPELLLAGLQKFHSDEFGFNAGDEDKKNEQLSKAFGLLDDYFDGDGDFEKIYGILQKELLENGFLSKLFQQENKVRTRKAAKN